MLWKQNRPKEIDPYKATSVFVPQTVDLMTNFEEFTNFLIKLRRIGITKRQNVFLKFDNCRNISIDGALVMLAEIQRCCQASGVFFTGNYPKHPHAFATLRDLKFFDLMTLANKPAWFSNMKPEEGVVILEMATGNHSKPQEVDKTIQKLIYGDYDKDRESNDFSRLAYRALTEAMTNALEHAYPEDEVRDWIRGQWWMTGYKHSKAGDLVLVFYDIGVGIPGTVPRRWPLFVDQLKALFGVDLSDSQLIDIATRVGESQTGEENRGKGLQDLKKIVADLCVEGALEIFSGKGLYRYQGEGKPILRRDFRNKLDGTLIVWNVKGVEGVKQNAA